MRIKYWRNKGVHFTGAALVAMLLAPSWSACAAEKSSDEDVMHAAVAAGAAGAAAMASSGATTASELAASSAAQLGELSADDREPATFTSTDSGSGAGASQESSSEEGLAEVEAVAANMSCSVSRRTKTTATITCTGHGVVREVIDCTAPQIDDAKSAWYDFEGSVRIWGQCKYGINSVNWEIKNF